MPVIILRPAIALADIGPGPVSDATDSRAAQVAWVAGVCVAAILGALVVARVVRSARNRLMCADTALIVLTYPMVWAFGYQDHPWHFHAAATALAMLATIAAAIVFALGEGTDPPVSRVWTVGAIVITVSSVGAATLWDVLWQPENDVIGPGVMALPLLWTGMAAMVAVLVIAVMRRRTGGGPTHRHT